MKKGIIQEIKKNELKQKLFHKHCSDGDKGIANWCVTLIRPGWGQKRVKKERTILDEQLNTRAPVGFNDGQVAGPGGLANLRRR